MKFYFSALLCLFFITKMQSAAKRGVNELNKVNSTLIQDDKNKNKLTIEEKMAKYHGSFQIEMKSERMKPNIPYNLDELIEKNRKQNEVVFVKISDNTRLKIYPQSEVSKNVNDKKFKVITGYSN